MTWQFDVSGGPNPGTYTLNWFVPAGILEARNITITGGIFDGVALSTGGTAPSRILSTLQRRLANLNVQNGHRALGDGIFDSLDTAFDGGDGAPVVTASGFSASTAGVANWLGKKRQEQLQNRLADLPSHEDGTKMVVTPAANLLPLRQPRWNAWIRGSYTHYDGDGSSFDGHTIDVLAGFDYRLDESVLIGIVSGYGNIDFDTLTDGTSGAFSADGFTVGPYVGVKLDRNVRLDALAAYTYSDYDTRAGVVRGDFAAHRVTVGARLKGTWVSSAGFFFEPGAHVLYAEEYQVSYTDSAGTRQSSLTVKAGRVSIGPKLGFVHRSGDNTTVKTWIAAFGEYEFSNQDNQPTSGLPDFLDIISGRVSAGISASTPDGVGVSVKGDVSGLGSGEYISYGGTAELKLPL